MATNNRELTPLYGYGARQIDREKAGYRPKANENTKEPGKLTTFFWHVLSRVMPISDDEQFAHRNPKGDPESYDLRNWL